MNNYRIHNTNPVKRDKMIEEWQLRNLWLDFLKTVAKKLPEKKSYSCLHKVTVAAASTIRPVVYLMLLEEDNSCNV